MTTMRFTLFGLSIAVLGATTMPAPAEAQLGGGTPISLKVCVKTSGIYNDSGNGEDNWTTNTTRATTGAYIQVFGPGGFGGIVFSGKLGDGIGGSDPGDGCTTSFTALQNENYTVEISSFGDMNSNSIAVREDGNVFALDSFSFAPASGGTITLTFTPANDEHKRVWYTYLAAAETITRSNGGGSGATLSIYIDQTATNYQSSGTRINVSLTNTQRKFIISHEVGHAVHNIVAGRSDPTSCASNFTACPGPTGGGHFVRSEETQGCAENEGFANFWGALAWNFKQFDCKFVVGSVTFDCELGVSGQEVKYHETQCSAASGRGVELDWLRTYWDVWTDASGVTSHNIVEFIGDADSWTAASAFTELDAEANTYGGQLNTNWDIAESRNGIYY